MGDDYDDDFEDYKDDFDDDFNSSSAKPVDLSAAKAPDVKPPMTYKLRDEGVRSRFVLSHQLISAKDALDVRESGRPPIGVTVTASAATTAARKPTVSSALALCSANKRSFVLRCSASDRWIDG